MADRPRELDDFKGVGHFEAKFQVEMLRFTPMSMNR